MYDNIGDKLQIVAKVLAWVGIISSIISGIAVVFTAKELAFAGIMIIVVGCLGSWISSLVMYGVGYSIEQNEIILRRIKKNQVAPTQNTTSDVKIPTTKSDDVYKSESKKLCPHCGELVTSRFCRRCGQNNNLFV